MFHDIYNFTQYLLWLQGSIVRAGTLLSGKIHRWLVGAMTTPTFCKPHLADLHDHS